MKKLTLESLEVQSFVSLSREKREFLLGGGDGDDRTQVVKTGFTGFCCGGLICDLPI